MNNIVKFPQPAAILNSLENASRTADNPTHKPPGGGGTGGSSMEARVLKVEGIAEKTSVQLTALEKDVAVIKSNYATKADVAEAKNSVIMWVVSAILLAQLLPALLKKFGL